MKIIDMIYSLPNYIDKERESNIYNLFELLFSNVHKSYDVAKLLKYFKFGYYPLVQPDFKILTSSTDNQYLLPDGDYLGLVYDNEMYPNKIYLNNNSTSDNIFKFQAPQFLNSLIYTLFKRIESKYNYVKDDNVIYDKYHNFKYEFQEEVIKDFNICGNVIYLITDTKLVLFDMVNRLVEYTISYNFSSYESFLVIPNGIIVKDNSDNYTNLEFVFDYIVEEDSNFYTLDHSTDNLNVSEFYQIDNIHDDMRQIIFKLDRKETTLQSTFLINVLYNYVMMLGRDQINLMESGNLKNLVKSYNNLNYNNKLLIVDELIQNSSSY